MTTAFGPQLANVALSPSGTESTVRFDFDTWFKDATGPGQCDGTAVDAAFYTMLIGNIRQAVSGAGVPLAQGDFTLLLQAIEKIAAQSGVQTTNGGIITVGNNASLTLGDGSQPTVGFDQTVDLNPVSDRLQVYSSSTNGQSESTPYSIVRSVVRSGGLVTINQIPNSGEIQIGLDSSTLALASTQINAGVGMSGGGQLGSGSITLDFDIPTLSENASVDRNLDEIAYYRASSGQHHRIPLDNFLGPYIDRAGDDVDGQLRFADGSAAMPAISFTGDSDLGFYRSGVGELSISAGGVQVGRFDSSGFTTFGGTTAVSAVDLQVSDNIITLNQGETGAGVTAGVSGWSVDRGTLVPATLTFNEGIDAWQINGGAGNENIVSTVTSVGGGESVISGALGNNLDLKSISGLAGITVTSTADNVAIDLDYTSLPLETSVTQATASITFLDSTDSREKRIIIDDFLASIQIPQGSVV